MYSESARSYTALHNSCTSRRVATLTDVPRRLLFLAYHFPPSLEIGAARGWYISKFLARSGWTVTVVTPECGVVFDSVDVDRASREAQQEGIERVFAGKLKSAFRRPSSRNCVVWLRYSSRLLVRRVLKFLGIKENELWLWSCLRACSHFRRGQFDLVLATGSPFSSFVAAKRVAGRLGIPFVLDYRDPWALSPYRSRTDALWVMPLERCLVRSAAAIVMVSPSQSRYQAEIFKLPTSPKVITNGYDPEQLADIVPAGLADCAVIYAGSFYEGRREIGPVLMAIKEAAALLGANGPPIRFHYYGTEMEHVVRQAKVHDAEHLVECHGGVSRAEALAAVKGADAVVVITGLEQHAPPSERGIITGKIFEPLGMGVKILLVAPEGSDARPIVEGANAGRSFLASEVAAMAQWLAELAREGRKGWYEPPEAYSWNELAVQFDELLQDAIDIPRDVTPNTRPDITIGPP